MGSPRLRAGEPGIALLGEPLRGARLGRADGARVSSRLAGACGGECRSNGAHQLPAAIGDLHDHLLWPRLRAFCAGRPRRPVRNRPGGLGVSARRIVRVAALLRRRSRRVDHALDRVRTPAALYAPVSRMNSRDLCFIPAADLVRLYRSRKASPLEVMQAVLARIEAVNPAVNAYVTVARDSALAKARAATRALGRKGRTLPPLHGVPVSIKDLTATRGVRTTQGSLMYRDHVPEEDDLVVQRLKAAGAIVVGKTNTPEFGAG